MFPPLLALNPQQTRILFMMTIVHTSSVYTLLDTILDLMSEPCPHAVKLVDTWSIPDWLLNNALGRYDGKIRGAVRFGASAQSTEWSEV
ncbi:hypothetical protein EJ02DRAFT_455613 [Clathrospora elynae]|uniref:Acyl-CoA oxidase C-terminal domain-containing protein n=1 Tax=Clathrospora elynae TaxID=706981 RepID=A0A6A5SJZ6_9PLEO|nr:hypothetical protein EJ02DRAFT_455613 [Clathrospora elynae]